MFWLSLPPFPNRGDDGSGAQNSSRPSMRNQANGHCFATRGLHVACDFLRRAARELTSPISMTA
jgi:hypothetical protein